jgi:hypothetical protein
MLCISAHACMAESYLRVISTLKGKEPSLNAIAESLVPVAMRIREWPAEYVQTQRHAQIMTTERAFGIERILPRQGNY